MITSSAAALFCALTLTACTDAAVRDVPVYPVLPQTTCAVEPGKPAPDASDKAIVAYFEAVRLAGADCRVRLNEIHNAAQHWPTPKE